METWKPLPINFENYRSQHPENGQVDEIIVTDKILFGNDEEYSLQMSFSDGYAIEHRSDDCEPLVMIYPTIEQVNADASLKKAIIEYTQGASDDDIIPYDCAILFGILYKASQIDELSH